MGKTTPYHLVFMFMFSLMGLRVISAQNNSAVSAIKRINIPISQSRYYIVLYKDTKPDDVPQEIYDGLWEIQKEVVDNFTYDYAVLNGSKKSPYGYGATKEDYYLHKRGVCDDYSNFFILLAREKGLTENLYKVSGNRRGGSGHAWLEYRTAENVYIIDPTWSDDYAYGNSQTRQRYRESPAYGRQAFFITYSEDAIIFPVRNGYNHSTYTGKTETPLWE
jgi:transglutaminase/protease-like cytokinesis protein 3